MKLPSIYQLLKIGIAKRLVPEIFSRYEAGIRFNPERRSYIPGWVQDARFDADQLTREEIVRKSRYFERNNGLLNRLADVFEQYTVGANGLQFIPDSNDESWNQNNAEAFETWSNFADLNSRQSFASIQSLIARAWFVDGECFIQKTFGKPRMNSQSFPRIRLIESHRVKTPSDKARDENIIDGVKVDGNGRVEGYYVREASIAGPMFVSDETYTFVPSENMLHVFEPSRIGMYRGLPFAYAVLNDLHDLDDLQILEMDAAKEAASVEKVIKTKSGELDDDALRAEIFKAGDDDEKTSGGSAENRTKYYQEVWKSKAKILTHGDEFEQYQSNRPSVAVQEYWQHLISKICAGIGISKQLVFPFSIQGTIARADMDVSDAFFKSRSKVISHCMTDIYRWVTAWNIRNISSLRNRPKYWDRLTIIPPASVNVDVGYKAKALIEQYKAGFISLEDVCGPFGLHWRDVLRKNATQREKARELEKEFGLEPGELIRATLEAIESSQKNQGNFLGQQP